MNNEFSIIIDQDRKYTLVKYLSLECVIEHNPCPESLVRFIKAFPEELLLTEIDPDNITNYHVNAFKKLMKLLTKDDEWWGDVIDFLEGNNFIKCDDLTDEEWNRYWKNLERREARAKAKKKSKK